MIVHNNKVIEDRKDGKSYGEIRNKYGISRSTVQYIILLNNKCKKKNGRKEVTLRLIIKYTVINYIPLDI